MTLRLRTPTHTASGPLLNPQAVGKRCLALSIYAILAAVLCAGPAQAEPDSTAVNPPERTGVSRQSRLRTDTKTARSVSSEGWWPGMAGIAVILAIGGGITAVARRFAPRTAAGAVQVVGRVSLSPRHSVYLLRVGKKVLLVGAGPQGPPSLLSELDEFPDIPPSPHREDDA